MGYFVWIILLLEIEFFIYKMSNIIFFQSVDLIQGQSKTGL